MSVPKGELPFFSDELATRSGVGMFGAARVKVTPATEAAGVAGLVGTVHGHTTPSLGYLTDLIGEPVDDLAVNVHFDDTGTSVWLTPDLVENVDSRPGTVFQIGGKSFLRNEDGTWQQLPAEAGGASGRS